LAAAWVLLLVTIGGLEDHTWFLFGVGLLGMAHNVLVAGVKRDSKAHGIPLQFFPRDELNDPHKPFVIEDESILQSWPKNNVMRALISAEKAYTGVGYRLLPIFFPGDLQPGREEDYWKKVEQVREEKREAKRSKNKPKALSETHKKEDGKWHPRVEDGNGKGKERNRSADVGLKE
jgi:hypothetical protein